MGVAMELRALVFGAGGVLFLATGCGSADHPAPSDSLVTDQSAISVPPPATGPACEPRSNRECHITYVDYGGQLHCPTDVEICAVDGMSWLPCGMFIYDDDHYPVPNPLPRQPSR